MTARTGRPTKSGAWVVYDVELGKVLLKPHADAPLCFGYDVSEAAEIRDALDRAISDLEVLLAVVAVKRACADAASDDGGAV